jgi:dihydroorotate dehydrogenase electron transfer subunit
VLEAAEAARRWRPGHFAMVGVGGVLRRSVPIHRADVEAGTVELVVTGEPAGERVDLIAPLGTPFPVGDGPVSALVAEGEGSVPLFTLGEELKRRGGQIGFVLGAASADRLFGAEQARALTGDVLVLTEDGSAGMRGRVTEPLATAIKAIDARVVYACGPTAVLREVARTARELAARCWTAVAEPMPCGVGLCQGCVLPVIGEDGVSRFVRSCTDGPVFDGARVRWDGIGGIPAELAGAAAMGVGA